MAGLESADPLLSARLPRLALPRHFPLFAPRLPFRAIIDNMSDERYTQYRRSNITSLLLLTLTGCLFNIYTVCIVELSIIYFDQDLEIRDVKDLTAQL